MKKDVQSLLNLMQKSYKSIFVRNIWKWYWKFCLGCCTMCGATSTKEWVSASERRCFSICVIIAAENFSVKTVWWMIDSTNTVTCKCFGTLGSLQSWNSNLHESSISSDVSTIIFLTSSRHERSNTYLNKRTLNIQSWTRVVLQVC